MVTPARPAASNQPLLPVLSLEAGAALPDPAELATWYLAVAGAVAQEAPNDLFALWLYPTAGGSVLLGPEALGEDKVEVPVPAPKLLQDELFALEQVLRQARYVSALAIPVRHEARDAGVMLLGSFGPGAFGPAQAVSLYRLAGGLAPTLATLAGSLRAGAHAALEPAPSREALPEHLARAVAEAADGPDLVRRTSSVLSMLLPHDRLDILVTSRTAALVPLSGVAARRRWSRAAHAADPHAAIVSRLGDARAALLDEAEGAAEIGWQTSVGGVSGLPARSLVAAQLEVGGRRIGVLVAGSVARDAYRPGDEDLLGLAALLVAPRVAALGQPEPDPAEPAPAAATDALTRGASALAGAGRLEEALREFAAALGRVVPHARITLNLRSGDAQVIALDPAAPRPLADLPAVRVAEDPLGAVLRGEQEWAMAERDGAEELLVPLRIAGRVIGVLGAVSTPSGHPAPDRAAVLLSRFADLLAPHLELLRRGSPPPAPLRIPASP